MTPTIPYSCPFCQQVFQESVYWTAHIINCPALHQQSHKTSRGTSEVHGPAWDTEGGRHDGARAVETGGGSRTEAKTQGERR